MKGEKAMNIDTRIKSTFSTKNHAGEVVQITVTFDLGGASKSDVSSWISSNRTIALQRVIRTLSASEIKELDGTTVRAVDAGKTIESPSAKIKKLVDGGMPEALATIAVNDPDKFNALLAKVKID
jgi:hypothetical protein